jgi:alpha-beta hydrolase superfamily lysophospholipase
MTDSTTIELTEHTQVWFGDEERPLYGFVSRPASGLVRGAVVLCPPVGEEGRAAHRTFRVLAEQLAARGLLALRFDYDGTGDSAGRQGDPERVASWLASVEAARQYLLDLGAPGVAALGMRLGATLAAVQAGAGSPYTSLVAWDPCLSGRTFLREGEALYSFGDNAPGEAPDDGLRHTPGFQYDAATATALRGVDFGKIPAGTRLAERVLLLSRIDRPAPDGIAGRLSAEPDFTQDEATDQKLLLDLPPSDNHVPHAALRRVVDWLAAGVADQPEVPTKDPGEEREVLLDSGARGSLQVRERSVWIGPAGIYGVATEPLDRRADDHPAKAQPTPWVVLVNVAAEAHLGPGRRWVEWARSWAADGYRVLRIDQSGIGNSPTRPGELEDQPFAPEWIDDMREVVQELRADGAKVGLVGLCSGAYSSFEAAMWEHVDAVFATNPRLTLYPAAKNTPVYTKRRRAAMVPNLPIARLSVEHRIFAGALWRIYREFAVWHAPFLIPWRVWRRGTAVEIVACRDDAQHFYEVYFWRPLFVLLQKSRRFTFVEDDVYDHSLLGRRGQEAMFARASAFLQTHLALPVHRRVRAERVRAGDRATKAVS